MTRPRRSSVSPSSKTTAVNATGIDAGKGAACVTNSSRDSVPVKRSSGVGVSPRGPLYGYMPLTERASESTTPRRCWWASARSSPCRHAASAIRTPLNAMTTRAPMMASASRSSSRVNPHWRRSRRRRLGRGPERDDLDPARVAPADLDVDLADAPFPGRRRPLEVGRRDDGHRALPVERAVLTLVVRLDRSDHLAGLLIGEQHGALVVAGHLQETQSLREPLDDRDDRHAQDRERDEHLEEREPRVPPRVRAAETVAHSRRFFTRPVTASMVTR